MNKSNFKDPQTIIAIGVTIISLCALGVSLLQTHIMQEERELQREYSRASVWPRIEMRFEKGYDVNDGNLNKLVLNLTNSGVGPAIITDVKVTYEGIVVNDWWDLFEKQGIPDSIRTTINRSGFNDQVMKIGETLEILNLADNLPLAQAFLERKNGLSIVIYYESIYKEKWKYDGEQTVKLTSFEELPQEEQFH